MAWSSRIEWAERDVVSWMGRNHTCIIGIGKNLLEENLDSAWIYKSPLNHLILQGNWKRNSCTYEACTKNKVFTGVLPSVEERGDYLHQGHHRPLRPHLVWTPQQFRHPRKLHATPSNKTLLSVLWWLVLRQSLCIQLKGMRRGT